MISRYGLFCRVIETGSFTKAAAQLGYSQSAVSQTVKSLEAELMTALIDRRRDGARLTSDGEQYYPYIQSVYAAERALSQKHSEMLGLEDSVVTLGTFTSVSRNLLPALMKAFKEHYPTVSFVLRQGEYTSIARWAREGSIDFGFVNAEAVSGIETHVLYRDEMMAVLPPSHPLCAHAEVTLAQLCREPFILLDEGDYSVPVHAFSRLGLEPHIEYEVYDDYTILAMVRQGLGVSAIYRRVLEGFEAGLEIRPIRETPVRSVALAWQNRETMSGAARRFADFVMLRAVPADNIAVMA